MDIRVNCLMLIMASSTIYGHLAGRGSKRPTKTDESHAERDNVDVEQCLLEAQPHR